MFPFVVLAYDRLILRRSGREFRRHLLRVHLPLIGAVVLLGAARVVVFVMVESAVASVAPARMLGYLTAQLGAIWKYVQLLMLPLHQSIAHNATGRVAQVLGAIVLGATCVLAFRLRKRAPLASFGVTWFLLLLLPSSSVVPLQSAIAEHRVYLASIGLFLVAGTGFAWVVQRLEGRPIGLRILLYAEGVFALAGLAALTAARHVVWTNPVALWREATINAPRWDTYTALGNALRDAGDCETALVAYAAASRVEPERLVPVAAAWACLTILGRSDEAREIARRVRRGDPQLTRLCQDVHALAPHMVSVQACVEQFDRAFGPGADG